MILVFFWRPPFPFEKWCLNQFVTFDSIPWHCFWSFLLVHNINRYVWFVSWRCRCPRSVPSSSGLKYGNWFFAGTSFQIFLAGGGVTGTSLSVSSSSGACLSEPWSAGGAGNWSTAPASAPWSAGGAGTWSAAPSSYHQHLWEDVWATQNLQVDGWGWHNGDLPRDFNSSVYTE